MFSNFGILSPFFSECFLLSEFVRLFDFRASSVFPVALSFLYFFWFFETLRLRVLKTCAPLCSAIGLSCL